MFGQLNGSVPFILDFVLEAKINSSLLSPEVLQKLYLFSDQDQSYYAESLPKESDVQVQTFIQEFLAYLAGDGKNISTALWNSTYLNMFAEISTSNMTPETKNA